MISQNEWNLSGKVIEVKEKTTSVLLIVKGVLSRPSLFNLNGTIPCVVSKELASNMDFTKPVSVTGNMVFGKQNFLMVRSL